MAIHWLLSLVCLLASLVVAQDYYYSEGGPSDTAVTTKSVTETVTKYLSQCSPESTSSSISDTTLSSTTTITSTLESTISIVVTSNVSDASGAAPTGLTSSQSGISFTGLTYQPTVTGGGPCSGLNCSSAIANTTTSSCSTATVVVSPPTITLTTSLMSPSAHSTISVHGTSSAAATDVPPSQIPVSGSSRLGGDAALQGFLGALGVMSLLVARFL
ncbi:hypothetical protein GGS26DRAFT_598193 [Hypomontagnella submonticulosa]|nr:hypothetical protein GGS26DRAFT_598193 [Hypomontagnella submonticulosa]